MKSASCNRKEFQVLREEESLKCSLPDRKRTSQSIKREHHAPNLRRHNLWFKNHLNNANNTHSIQNYTQTITHSTFYNILSNSVRLSFTQFHTRHRTNTKYFQWKICLNLCMEFLLFVSDLPLELNVHWKWFANV